MAHSLKCLIPTIGSPATLNGNEGRYELAAFYGELLDMKIANEGWLLIAAPGEGTKFFIALDRDGWEDHRPPRWPGPEYPQQIHLDVLVPDLDTAGDLVTGQGATLLQDRGDFRVFADPVGHPFCLYPDPYAGKPVVGRLVFDCFSPRNVASFYEGFLQARGRVEDTPQRVVVDLGDDLLPHLAFQQAQFRAARWPDPAYPAQLHVDYRWHDGLTARAALERAESLGGIRLPQLAGAGIYADPASHPFCIQNEIPTVFDIVGLYLNPPEYAVVYCVDETSQVQALASAPATATGARHPRPHDEARDVTGLFAASQVTDATMTGSPDRTRDLTRFLTEIDSTVPSHLDVNLICDWDGTYEAAAVQGWLADHPRFQVHRNPPDPSWSEQVEGWFAYLADDSIRRGDHTSARVLEADIRSWAQAWDNNPEPFGWAKPTDQIMQSLDRLVAHISGAR